MCVQISGAWIALRREKQDSRLVDAAYNLILNGGEPLSRLRAGRNIVARGIRVVEKSSSKKRVIRMANDSD